MRTILLVASFLSFMPPTFAGDMSLICETVDGDEMAFDMIEKDQAEVSFVDTIRSAPYKFNVELVTTENDFIYTISQEYLGERGQSIGRPSIYEVRTSEYHQQFRVSDNRFCFVND